MFILLVVILILWTLCAAGGYSLGKAFPQPGVVLAGVLVGMLAFLWWYVLRDGPDDSLAGFVGLGILVWLSTLPMLFVVGLASGAWARPGLTVGVWLATVVSSLLMAWSPAFGGIAPLLFGGFGVAGGMWRGPRMRDDPAR